MTMTWYLYNSNGEAYEIVAKYKSRTGAEHYLLASHNGLEDDRADTVTQYIVAHDYNSKFQCWARGEYFPVWQAAALDNALAAWKELICDEADNF